MHDPSTLPRPPEPILDQGRDLSTATYCVETVDSDDDESYAEMDMNPGMLNAIDITPVDFFHSDDFYYEDPASCADTFDDDADTDNDVAPDDESIGPCRQCPIAAVQLGEGHHAAMDTAAWVSCTGYKNILWGYREFSADYPCPISLAPATHGSDVKPVGWGYAHVPADTVDGFIPVRMFHTPKLRTTVIDERDFVRAAGANPRKYTTQSIVKYPDTGKCTFHAEHHLRKNQDIKVYGVLVDGKCYTNALIPPTVDATHPDASPTNSIDVLKQDDSDFADACARATIQTIAAYQEEEQHLLLQALRDVPVAFHDLPFHEYIQRSTPVTAISQATERLLWHQRLGHPADHALYHFHENTAGVPRFKHMDAVMDKCPTCIRAKQTKEPAGPNSTRTATRPHQGYSIDFSFSGTMSKDSTRSTDYVGLNGETSWILIQDHFTGERFGDTRVSKAAPITFLRAFLQQNAPTCSGKYVIMDQGGELYHNPEVVRLFEHYGYDIRPTGADASNQNGVVERTHLTVANAIRAFLIGANLAVKFWPYAFHHYIRLLNSTPSRTREKPPLILAGKPPDDLSAFRTFGCRVWVRPPHRRKAKFKSTSRKGIFLGFIPRTTKNIIWYDVETERVKLAKHARFDEGMNDLHHDTIPPNVIHLQRTRDGQAFPIEPDESSVPRFECRLSPFSHTLTKTLKVTCDDSTFGMQIGTDELNQRAYLRDIQRDSSVAKMFSSHKAACNKIRGAYIVSINGNPVFTQTDAIRELRKVFDTKAPDVDIEFAPERRLDAKRMRKALIEHDLFRPASSVDDDNVPLMSIEDLRSVASIQFPDDDFSPASLTDDEIRIAINAVQTHETPEERALGRFTRHRLRKLPTWPDWLQGERKQLDQMDTLGMYGKPVPRPPGAIVLRPHWQYHIKRNGTRRSRNCCDGSPRAAPLLHKVVSTYNSCVEQPIQRTFFALAASKGYRVYGGDAEDAYAHSPPPERPTYVSIDDAYADWYEHKHGIKLDRSLVLPVLHALQGHPESGRLWEMHINGILRDLGFAPTTHDRAIYSATIDGQIILLLRQVDDFALASPSENIAKDVYTSVGKRLQLPSEAKPPFKCFGMIDDFNGVDIHQTSTAIEISCSRHIERVLKTHGWLTPSSTVHPNVAPLPVDAISLMYANDGPHEGTPEHRALEDKYGFSYRSLLGELMYAYVTCRPDIGYAIVTLSKFSTCPTHEHYALLKKVAKYLRSTKDWAIIYRKPTVDGSLPKSTHPRVPEDHSLPAFPTAPGLDTLLCFVDAAHANDLRNRRSTTGYAFTLAGGVVSYRCKTQSVTATSSTEAEFIAAVLAAKQARYLRSVLKELGFPQSAPTKLYEDNQSAIQMVNARVPTERSRHIDIVHFAIQDWKDAGDIVLEYCPGIINPSDDLTKPLGWILHSRHARRLMGHYG